MRVGLKGREVGKSTDFGSHSNPHLARPTTTRSIAVSCSLVVLQLLGPELREHDARAVVQRVGRRAVVGGDARLLRQALELELLWLRVYVWEGGPTEDSVSRLVAPPFLPSFLPSQPN